MKFGNSLRLVAVTVVSGLAVVTLSGFFFFIPLGLFLPNDKKTIDEMEQKKDWTGMLSLSETRLKSKENDPAWLYINGFALRRLNRCGEAIPQFQKAIAEKNNDYDAATTEMGVCQMDTGALDAAIATFYGGIGKHPEEWKHYHNLALTYAKKEDFENARKYLELLKPRNAVMATQLENQSIRPQEDRVAQRKIQAEAEQRARVAKEEEEVKAKADAQTAVAEKARIDAEAALRAETEAKDAEKARIATAANVSSKSLEVRLMDLKQLYSKGLISKEIYDSKQREILKSH